MHAMLADEIQVHHHNTNFSTDFDPMSLIIVSEIYGQVARKSYSPMPNAKSKGTRFLIICRNIKMAYFENPLKV